LTVLVVATTARMAPKLRKLDMKELEEPAAWQGQSQVSFQEVFS
jgi:hypothetical protein